MKTLEVPEFDQLYNDKTVYFYDGNNNILKGNIKCVYSNKKLRIEDDKENNYLVDIENLTDRPRKNDIDFMEAYCEILKIILLFMLGTMLGIILINLIFNN